MKFYEVADEHKKHPAKKTILPKRATRKSAGFDFFTKVDVILKPNRVTYIHTDVKCELADDEVLLIFPRSSMAIKNGVVMANTVGVIDADYFENTDNDGNITIALRWITESEKNMPLREKTRIAQGVVVKYQTDGEPVEAERTGGIGSTGE